MRWETINQTLDKINSYITNPCTINPSITNSDIINPCIINISTKRSLKLSMLAPPLPHYIYTYRHQPSSLSSIKKIFSPYQIHY